MDRETFRPSRQFGIDWGRRVPTASLRRIGVDAPTAGAVRAVKRLARAMRILLVEDDGRIAMDVSKALGEAGYVVEHAANGEDAWFLGDTEKFAAVVLDLGLPGLDGLTVLKRWRDRGCETPVLVLTARGSWSERVRGYRRRGRRLSSQAFSARGTARSLTIDHPAISGPCLLGVDSGTSLARRTQHDRQGRRCFDRPFGARI